MTSKQKTCGDCALYLTTECTYLQDHREGVLKSTDSACDDFEQKVKITAGKRKSHADTLVKLCLEKEPELFHDQTKTCYARVRRDGIYTTLPIRSKPFKVWLAHLLWLAVEKAVGSEALQGALNILEAKAMFEGKLYTLYNRVAPAEDGIWIDMNDDRWRAIKVTAEGWHIVENPPILFKHHSHQKPLPIPASNGDSKLFLKFVNVKDEDTQLLLLCTVISYLLPMIPHVILTLYGIQGSGKTCLFKMIRAIIDPSIIDVLTLPRDERERVQQLDHHWCAFYDNVTRLPTWMSDTLCRAATGGGFSKRELYTNDSDIIYSFKRCVGLNGINIAAQRGDLLDRSLLVGLQAIPKNERRTEKELWLEFEKHKAQILGGFLDTLVEAIRVFPSINPKGGLFRMADFTRWGCAITKALGYKETRFIEAYNVKVRTQIEEAAYASPLAAVLIDYMRGLEEWKGTPSEFYSTMVAHAKELGISTRQKIFPKAPNSLVRQLNELAPSLKSLGLEVVTGKKSGSTRFITVTTVPTVPIREDNVKVRDGRDDIFPTSSSPTIQETIEYAVNMMAKRKPDNTTEDMFLHDLQVKNMNKEEAQKVLDKLTDEGILAYDPQGWLVQVLGG